MELVKEYPTIDLKFFYDFNKELWFVVMEAENGQVLSISEGTPRQFTDDKKEIAAIIDQKVKQDSWMNA